MEVTPRHSSFDLALATDGGQPWVFELYEQEGVGVPVLQSAAANGAYGGPTRTY